MQIKFSLRGVIYLPPINQEIGAYCLHFSLIVKKKNHIWFQNHMDSLPILCRYISFVYIFLMGTFMIYHRAACIINVKISIFLKTLCRFWRENLKLEENFSFHHESGERSMSFRRPNFCTQKLWMQSFVLFKKNMLIFFSLVVVLFK